MGPAGFLCVGGVEVLNEARTRAYLRNCLGDSSWQFFDCDCPPLAASIVEGDCALVLDGTAGTFVSTPDLGPTDPKRVTGDLAIVMHDLAADVWASGSVQHLATRYPFAAGQRSYRTELTGAGALVLTLSDDGTGGAAVARAFDPPANGVSIEGLAVTWRQSDGRVQVFKRVSGVWEQQGTNGTIALASIHPGTASLRFGQREGQNGTEFAGRIGRVEIRSGDLNGTLVASPDFSAQAPGTTQFTDAQQNVWTLNGNAEIACALDEYGSPATDPAPWYSAQNAASAKFFGFIPERIEASVPTARRSTARLDEGSVLGPEQLLSRSYSFRGWLVAADEEGMRWGMRWMQEVLRGRICAPGCEGDDGELLISCADPTYFRSLVGVGLIDGPRYDVAVPDNHESVAVPTQFQIASQSSYLFSDGASVVSGVVADESDACAFFTTDEWFAGASLDIELSTALNATDITITMAISLDGTCDNLAAACAVIEIPFLPAESRLKIDGRRRTVTFFDPTGRVTRTGFNVTRWQGAFPWFDVEACAQMCICLDNAGPSPVTWQVTKFEKEL